MHYSSVSSCVFANAASPQQISRSNKPPAAALEVQFVFDGLFAGSIGCAGNRHADDFFWQFRWSRLSITSSIVDGDNCSMAAGEYFSAMGRVVKLGVWRTTLHFLSTGVLDAWRCAWLLSAVANSPWNDDSCSYGHRRDEHVGTGSPMAGGNNSICRGSSIRCEPLPS